MQMAGLFGLLMKRGPRAEQSGARGGGWRAGGPEIRMQAVASSLAIMPRPQCRQAEGCLGSLMNRGPRAEQSTGGRRDTRGGGTGVGSAIFTQLLPSLDTCDVRQQLLSGMRV